MHGFVEIEAYSQVQLRNFLKSSRLNQTIVKSVIKAEGISSEAKGEPIASDGSRRFVFVKDSNEKEEKRSNNYLYNGNSDRYSSHNTLHRSDGGLIETDATSQRKRLRRGTGHDQSRQESNLGITGNGWGEEEFDGNGINDDDDDDEDESLLQSMENGKKDPSNMPLITIQNSSSDDEDDEGGGGFVRNSDNETDEDDEGGGGFVRNSDHETDEDDEGGGGFVRNSDHETDEYQMDRADKSNFLDNEKGTKSSQNVITILSCDETSESDMDGGGFLPANQMNDENDEESTGISARNERIEAEIPIDRNQKETSNQVQRAATENDIDARGSVGENLEEQYKGTKAESPLEDGTDELLLPSYKKRNDDIKNPGNDLVKGKVGERAVSLCITSDRNTISFSKGEESPELLKQQKQTVKKSELSQYIIKDRELLPAFTEKERDSEKSGKRLSSEEVSFGTSTTASKSNGTLELNQEMNPTNHLEKIKLLEKEQQKAIETSNVNHSRENDSNSDEDDIDWEDGDEKSVPEPLVDTGKSQNAHLSLETKSVSMTHKTDHEQEDDKNRTSHKPVVKKAISERSESFVFDDNDSDNDENVSGVKINKSFDLGRNEDFLYESDHLNQKENANAVALRHAQTTAAKLTDWAGRAVQRAIAAHLEESTEHSTTTESPINEDTRVADEKCINTQFIEEPNDGKEPVNKDEDRKFYEPAVPGNVDEKVDDNGGTPINGHPGISFQPQDTSLPLNEPEISTLSLEALHQNHDQMKEEYNRQQRDADMVTDEMKEEVIQLLQLFGIPYLEAPAEAEAQCAALEGLGLVDGVVTEDSDAIVFGAKNVYKNCFDDQKYVEVYLSTDAERLGISRNEKVALAMLLGGDYTEGVKGVGIVNGMEILQAFPMTNGIKEGLTKFREWLDGFDPMNLKTSKESEKASKEQLFHRKHQSARSRWLAPKDFPAQNVMQAYLKPVVDKSQQKFSWGTPDLKNLRLFCSNKMGWEYAETDRAIIPVIKQMESGLRQTRIESYFMRYEDNIKFAEIRSRRLRDVFGNVEKGRKTDSETEPLAKGKGASSDSPTDLLLEN